MAKPRTKKQNNSLHLFCRELAEELNAHGITQGEFAAALEVDNTEESVKEAIKAMAFKKYLENSTTKLSTVELQSLYEEVMRVIAFHPQWNLKHIDWPSEETK